MAYDHSQISAFANVGASQTDSVLVTAPSGTQRVRVLTVVINQGDTTPSTVTFNSKGSGAGTAISPLLKSGANGTISINAGGGPLFSTLAGQGLTVTTGAGSTTGILVVYALAT